MMNIHFIGYEYFGASWATKIGTTENKFATQRHSAY